MRLASGALTLPCIDSPPLGLNRRQIKQYPINLAGGELGGMSELVFNTPITCLDRVAISLGID
jgi:hypothetical protein